MEDGRFGEYELKLGVGLGRAIFAYGQCPYAAARTAVENQPGCAQRSKTGLGEEFGGGRSGGRLPVGRKRI